MLKLELFLLFLSPVCFINNMYWTVQISLFFISFIFLIMNNFSNYFSAVSYYLGCDMLSYGLIF